MHESCQIKRSWESLWAMQSSLLSYWLRVLLITIILCILKLGIYKKYDELLSLAPHMAKMWEQRKRKRPPGSLYDSPINKRSSFL